MAWRARSLLLAALALLAAAPGLAGDTQTEVMPEVNAFLKLGKDVRLYLLTDLTYAPASWSADGTKTTEELELGPHLDFTLKPLRRKLRTSNWERERYLWARVGYNYVTTLGASSETSHENRAIVEATFRLNLPGELWAVNRARVDFRDKNGKYTNRYRYRLTLERETPILGTETVPYVSAELLYDTRYDAWSEQRYQAGVEVVLDKSWRLEPYYQRKEDDRSEPHHTNVIGLILKYYH